MIRKVLKKTTKSEKLKTFIKKYKVPPEFLQANRKMISRGILIGIFIAFIPMPMQMALVLAFMPVFRFNVPIALAMCWLSNPFTMPPMYYMEYLTGSFFLGSEISNVEMNVEWFQENIDDIFIPLYLGTFFYSFVGSISAYWAVNHFWKKSVHTAKKKHRHHR
ncbi:hypothetical protein MNB_SM-4-1674 [hydrothermal vent metagenome]|uniref:DUF2062 domain-containing protein n=1 Tax=hydrothermal vent metagenome TaxID=652676 RepID=A0A1W1CVV7_9ZZZZ